MNNRLKKKLRRRNGFRKYVNYRGDLINQSLRNNEKLAEFDMLYVVTSPNNKHINHIYGMNMKPDGIDVTHENGETEVNVNFRGIPMPDAFVSVDDKSMPYSEILESWRHWLEGVTVDTPEKKSSHAEADRMDTFRYFDPEVMKNIIEAERATKGTTPLEERLTKFQQQPLEDLLKPHPIVPITAADIADATEAPDEYHLVMPKDMDEMRRKSVEIRTRNTPILSVFPGVAVDLDGIVETWLLDTNGLKQSHRMNGKTYVDIDVALLLDRLYEATEDDTRFVILPWCPGFRLAMNTFNIHYAYIRPQYGDRYTLAYVARRTAELEGNPIEDGSFTDYLLTYLENRWDSFFAEDIESYEKIRYGSGAEVLRNPTIIYRPRRNVTTGLYQLEDKILEEFNREWPRF